MAAMAMAYNARRPLLPPALPVFLASAIAAGQSPTLQI
jgi:hypothetical protein